MVSGPTTIPDVLEEEEPTKVRYFAVPCSITSYPICLGAVAYQRVESKRTEWICEAAYHALPVGAT